MFISAIKKSYQANGKIFVTHKKLMKKPIIPIMIPTFAISFVSTRPVDEAIAFGGVEIGKSIAMEAHNATNEIIA